MIPRYEKTEISQFWTDEYKFSTYLKVELAILKALEGKKIPVGISKQIKEKATINPKRIEAIEEKTKHDIIAFCTSITENIDPEIGKYFHFGVTSSDIIDSALTLQIKASLEVIIPAFDKLLKTLKQRSIEQKSTITMGRSHGMFAEPMSLGQKFLGHYAELKRRFVDLKEYLDNELTVQYSGAIGSYTILTPEIEEEAARLLEVKCEPVSTQVIPRDRIAKLVGINALIASAIERLSVEIRHMHRSDVGELHEGFSKGQKGSSTMPHKKNPISAENLTGIARIIKSHNQVAIENIVLWHERDISHSSAERLYLPDNLGLLFYAITRMNSTIENLVFHKEKIEQKVKENYSYLSSYYLHHLIEKTDLSRDELYELVQKASFSGNTAESFFQELEQQLKNKNLTINLPKPNFKTIKEIYLKHVETIFGRV